VEAVVKKGLSVKKAKVAEAAKAAKDTAVTAASAAVSSGAKHLVLQLDLPASVSGKAMPEAYTAIKAEHPSLPCLLLAPDAEAGKCSVYTEVPKDVSKVLSASEWLKCAVGAMGGKGGGKPERAAGSGPDVSKVADAVKAANDYALSCLGAES
jgi:alanyl-tRNA synthetase